METKIKKRRLSISSLRNSHSIFSENDKKDSILTSVDNDSVESSKIVTNDPDVISSVKRPKKQGSKLVTNEPGVDINLKRSNIANSVDAISQFVNDKTIFVEGLPFSSSEEDVRRFFGECGRIISVRLPRWHDSNRLRGYGHVEFSEAAAIAKAYDLDGCDFLDTGRYVVVKPPQVPRSMQGRENEESTIRPPGCRSVFIKNLPYDVTEKDLIDLMMVCGPVAGVRLARWGHTNLLKGFGYVDFKREDSAEIAVKKKGQLVLKGRHIQIDYETGVPKGGFKKGSSQN